MPTRSPRPIRETPNGERTSCAGRCMASRSSSRITMTPPICGPRPARGRWRDGYRPTTHSWSRSCAMRGRSSSPSRTCTNSPTASPRSARCSVKPATRMPLDRNPGGSSGGTGVAIAANFAAIGMGSDTCGSIRIPASHNSLVGIRGTQGLASRSGIIPLSSTQDIGGPIARTVTDLAIVLDAIVGYDPADPQTAASVGNIPKSYTDFLQLTALRGVRIGLLTDLLGTDPADAEVASVVRGAAGEMKGQGAEIVDVAIPGLSDLLMDKANGFLIIRQDFKFDLNAYLAAHPSAPMRTLEEVLASGKFHPAVETNLRNSQAVETRDTAEYLAHIVKRNVLREAVLKAMADNQIEVLAYPTIRRKANVIGEMQMGSNCQLSANSGLPAITVPAGFTADGLPVGVEMLGRAWSEPQLIKLAYAYEQATHHRRPPASTPALDRR